jgi:hypothetical protein
MELLISIIVGVAIIEAYAWLPAACQWLLETAVCNLPTEDQERCREEWKADLETLPNTGVRLAHALTYILAARTITAETREETLEQLDEVVGELSTMQRGLEGKLAILEARAQELTLHGAAEEKRLQHAVRAPLRANDGETSESLKFSLEGEGQPSWSCDTRN